MQTSALITTKQLVRDLTQLGLCAGQTVLVHTSMKALGRYVVGDTPAVVDAPPSARRFRRPVDGDLSPGEFTAWECVGQVKEQLTLI